MFNSQKKIPFYKNASFYQGIMIFTPLLLGFGQYVESTLISQIDRVETAYARAVAGLGSNNSAAKSESIRNIKRISFAETPIEPQLGPFGFARSFAYWISGSSERRVLLRGRRILRDLVRTPKKRANGKTDNMVFTTTLGNIAIDWIEEEKSIGTTQSEYGFLLLGAQLPNSDLSRRQFENFLMSNSNFANSILRNTNLKRASLANSFLDNSIFDFSDLAETNLTQSKGENTSFKFVHGIGANFSNSQFSHSDFSTANLEQANFHSANLTKSNFASSILKRADFSKSNLKHANFSGADISQANFDRANLEGADLRFALNWRHATSLNTANVTGANLPKGWPILKN